MIKVEALVTLLTVALWIYCFIDVLRSEEPVVRTLPKLVWVFVVLLFPLAGSIGWLVLGRPDAAAGRSPHERAVPGYAEYDRPGRAAASTPEQDEAFLRDLRARAEEQRARYRAEKRRQQPED